MAMASISPLCAKFQTCCLLSRPSISTFHGGLHLKISQLKLSSSYSISSSGIRPILRQTRNDLVPISSPPRRSSPPAIFAAKGYKMKTHKASAKRFRVTGSGKIMRRRPGKQHLLAKKNTKRKLHLSKMVERKRIGFPKFFTKVPTKSKGLRIAAQDFQLPLFFNRPVQQNRTKAVMRLMTQGNQKDSQLKFFAGCTGYGHDEAGGREGLDGAFAEIFGAGGREGLVLGLQF